MSDLEMTLGISPGSRQIGVAVLEKRNLEYWQVKNFKGTWSQKKLYRILNTLEELISLYSVSCIALKVLHPNQCSAGLIQLTKGIKKLASKRRIKLAWFTVSEVKTKFTSQKRCSKKIIIESLLKAYPELSYESEKEKTNRNKYYIKIFEAISVAELAALGK